MGLFSKIRVKLFGSSSDTSTEFTYDGNILGTPDLPPNHFLLNDIIGKLGLSPYIVKNRGIKYFYFPLEQKVGDGDTPRFFMQDNTTYRRNKPLQVESFGEDMVIKQITFSRLPYKAKRLFIIECHFEGYNIESLNDKLKDEILKKKI